jgi:hypothetical protein
VIPPEALAIRRWREGISLRTQSFQQRPDELRLKQHSYWVRGVDLKYPECSASAADDFVVADLRCVDSRERILDRHFAGAYQLAADMGGVGYVFTGTNDSEVKDPAHQRTNRRPRPQFRQQARLGAHHAAARRFSKNLQMDRRPGSLYGRGKTSRVTTTSNTGSATQPEIGPGVREGDRTATS